MRNDWRRNKKKIKGFKTIKNKITGDIVLVGKHGEISFSSDDESKIALITKSVYHANRLAVLAGKTPDYKKGDEGYIKLEASLIDLALEIIKPYKTSPVQIRKANSF